MPEKTKEAIWITTLLVVMFCFFFWLGFFAGRHTATQVSAAPAAPRVPAGDRLSFQTAVR
ncbi:MAG: hypothetical protein HY238_06440 [Acidobacteria bacterium]|nr:hypothetical protein [Acidobacteriota bacterium]